MTEGRGDVTEILVAYRNGDPGAADALFDRVYEDLRRIARRQLSRHAARPLDTHSLVHEVYLKLVNQTRVEWQDRSHFLGVAAHAMRQVVVDFARRVRRKKRGGGVRAVTFEDDLAVHADADAVLAVNEALGQLDALDPRLTRLVELRFFAGFSEQESAEALGMSLRTAQREWMRAKAWLRHVLDAPGKAAPAP
jgi:RNA polymerase sigma factor (TIGR02999 family)